MKPHRAEWGAPDSQGGPGPTALLVDSEKPLRKLLHLNLGAQGWTLLECSNGQEALKKARAFAPDVILMDLNLPDIDGLMLIRKLRQFSRAPIIVISARSQDFEKVNALDSGADDYLTKPFAPPELLARMRVSLRHIAHRFPAAEGSIFESGPLRVDLLARIVWINGAEVHLTRREYRILVALIGRAGRVATHFELLSEVWGPEHTDNIEYLRVYMHNLRRKLDSHLAPAKRLILSESGVGYRLRTDSQPLPA